MSYRVGRVIVRADRNPELHTYFSETGRLANNLGNAALFRLRNHFTAKGKDVLSVNEQQVEDEVFKTESVSSKSGKRAVLSYTFLEKLMRVTENPDFFAKLPKQTAQAVLKERAGDMNNWTKSLKAYKKDPSSFTGKPKMPKYWKKGACHTYTMTNQDCVIYQDKKGFPVMKLPYTKIRLRIEELPEGAVLKEVKVKPYYNDFEVLYTYEVKDGETEASALPNKCGIDIGVDNTVSAVTNEGSSLLVKGGAVKAANQWFNKQKAYYTGILTRGKESAKHPSTHMLDSLSRNRNQFLTDHFHQLSAFFVKWCLERRVGTIVIGHNKDWKQNVNTGKKNNQTFVSIPFNTLIWMIRYKAEREGIRVIEQEESYTSKASFLDNDLIPVYGKNDKDASFSGRRIKRGLYRSKNGTVINADLNGAANILRKAEQDAFEGVKDFSFLQNPTVIRFTDLHKRNPVKGIAAV